MAKRKIVAEAVVFDFEGRVLLVKQGRKRHDWELPGGHVKTGESPVDAVVREVREETGVRTVARALLGVFHIPETPDREFYDFVFLCRLHRSRRTPRPRPRPPEIAACAFWPLDGLPEPLRRFTAERIEQGRTGFRQALVETLKPSQWLGPEATK